MSFLNLCSPAWRLDISHIWPFPLMRRFIVAEELCESDSGRLIHFELSSYLPQLSPLLILVRLLLLCMHFIQKYEMQRWFPRSVTASYFPGGAGVAHAYIFPSYLSFSISSFLSLSHFLLFCVCICSSLSLSIKLSGWLVPFPSFFITPLPSLSIHPSSLLFDRACVLFLSQWHRVSSQAMSQDQRIQPDGSPGSCPLVPLRNYNPSPEHASTCRHTCTHTLKHVACRRRRTPLLSV